MKFLRSATVQCAEIQIYRRRQGDINGGELFLRFGRTVRAAGRVQAILGDQKAVYRLAVHDVGFDDFVNIGRRDTPIPHCVGIDHDGGAMSHWSRHPDMLARTLFLNPRRANFCLKRNCNLAWPVGSQQPRGCPGSRWLQQMNRCFSNLGIEPIYRIYKVVRFTWLI